MIRKLSVLALATSMACVPGEFSGPEVPPPVSPSPSPTMTPSPSPSPTMTPSPSPSPSSPGEPTFDDHWNPQDPTEPADERKGSMRPASFTASRHAARQPRDGKAARRLTVAQLRASIPALFGGLTWTNNNRPTGTVMFNSLSRTLGEADYLGQTEENREPNPIFFKFMDDMAGQVCTNAVAADTARTVASERVVKPFAEDPDRNLRFLRLKLHGIHVPAGSTEGLTELRKLYDDVLADTRSADQAWSAVCVAMLTAPGFMAY